MFRVIETSTPETPESDWPQRCHKSLMEIHDSQTIIWNHTKPERKAQKISCSNIAFFVFIYILPFAFRSRLLLHDLNFSPRRHQLLINIFIFHLADLRLEKETWQ